MDTAVIFRPVWTEKTPQFHAYCKTFGQHTQTQPYRYCRSCGYVFRPEPDTSMGTGTTIDDGIKYPTKRFSDDYFNEVERRREVISEHRAAFVLEHVSPETMLDVGCAYGALIKDMAKRGITATGIDPWASLAEYGRERFGLNIDVDYYQETSYPAASFDLITAESSAYYLRPGGVVRFLEIARGHLRPGGAIYLQLGDTFKASVALMSNQVRSLVPYENVESVVARQGFEVIAKTRKNYPFGFYGVILRPLDEAIQMPQPTPQPMAKIADELALADYNLMRETGSQPAPAVRTAVLGLHHLFPGRWPAAYLCKAVNRIARWRGVYGTYSGISG